MEVNAATETVTVVQDNGSDVLFIWNNDTSEYNAAPWVQATLTKAGSNFIFTLPDQSTLEFNSQGRLESESDRNGNHVRLFYNSANQLETVEDAAGRELTFTNNGNGTVKSVTGPLGRTVHYEYLRKELVSVVVPGQETPRWRFEYDKDLMTRITDGRGRITFNWYDKYHRAEEQLDPMERYRTLKYTALASGSETTIDMPNESLTVERFNAAGLPTKITRASGTALATTTEYEYDSSDNLVAVTDANNHTTTYGYDAAGNKTSERDPDGDETKWTYDSKHNVLTMTTPRGEATTIKRDSDGDPEVIERPAPNGQVQATHYKYDVYGDLESVEDPLKRVWKYEYDPEGDRTGETDPAGAHRTWTYDAYSNVVATVSARGSKEPTKFTTKIERDEQERPTTITDPLGHTTKCSYDADGDLETLTDANNHVTSYQYDYDDELTKTTTPGSVSETAYDSEGNIAAETDGDKHTTKYVRNLLGEVTEIIDPDGRTTIKEYDAAGNLASLTDPEKRVTTYRYDAANRLTQISYSDGKTPNVVYIYNPDGERIETIDGTVTSTYGYDLLDRLTATTDGHGDNVGYEYDLDNEPTRVTYPNGKAIARSYDEDGRLEQITDWLGNTTSFTYDGDSDLARTSFPAATNDADTYSYNDADQITETVMKQASGGTLASLSYTRENDGALKSTMATGLPGEHETAYTYDENGRLTKAGSNIYEYDPANNPTKIGTGIYKYNAASQVETGPSLTYSYDELGERTKAKPSTGPATTYGYDEAGDLIAVERPKEGETPEVKDAYAYNGDGLRASQTISGTISYIAWDMAEELPVILSDGTNSYIYGPGGLPVEQISVGGTVTYLHHDQQGSTRLLTGSTGTVTGSTTFDAYGNKIVSTGTATTPLGYDGQYTNADTGLIYTRARTYDPATAQFLSVDPIASLTRAPYSYAADNPVNYYDPTGLSGIFGTGIGPNVGPDIDWSEGGFWSTAVHLTLGVAGVGDTLATGITTAIATPICFAGVSTAPVIGQIAGYPACATFAVGGASFTAYGAYETYWEFEQAFEGSGPAKSPKEAADACQLAERPPLVSGL